MPGMTTTLPAVRDTAPDLPGNEFAVGYFAGDGTRHRVPLASAWNHPPVATSPNRHSGHFAGAVSWLAATRPASFRASPQPRIAHGIRILGIQLRDLIISAPDEIRRSQQELMLVPAAGRGLTAGCG
jgi:hypothetical protein